jgi:carboxypeptidase family protein/TonB-dependent receptor-like protein
MKKRHLIPSALLLLLALATSRGVDAQVIYGSLTGNVTDQSGAVVAGAKVEALNIGTGVSTSVVTDERGAYLFSSLQAGLYKVTITAQTFKALAQDNVRVEVNTIRRLDAQLQVGDVSAVVQVTATTEALQTDRADVNFVQTARQINDLPLTGSVGRNFQSLLQLIPGTSKGTGGFFLGGGTGEDNSAAGNPQRSISYNVNGVSRMQNNTKIDGSGIVYPWLPTNTAYVPTAESIQEVNIVTNSFDAEQGIAGGAAVNVITKSGTNAYHGAGWVYDTNSATQARNFFQTTPQVPKNILVQWGYAVGGPIIKNKLFFFTDLERTTQRNFARVATFSIAPQSLRPNANGDVVFPTAAQGGATIYDPASNPDPRLRTPFPNNTIPGNSINNRIDPAALELIKRLPLPTGSGIANNFTPTGGAVFNRTNIDNKVTYNTGGKLTAFGRYSISPTNIFEPSILGDAGGDALNGGQLGNADGRVQVVGAGLAYTFSPNLIIDVNAGYTRQRLGAENVDIDSNFGLDVLKIPGTNGPDRLQGGIPAFQINSFANLGNANTGNPFLFRDNQYVLAANLSWIKGAHGLRFGVDYQNQQINHFQPQGGAFQTVRGTFQFNGNPTALQPGTCQGCNPNAVAANAFNSWAAFLLGLPIGAGKVDQLRNPNSIYMQAYALYARDHWQATRNLTINYGLRWERYPFPDKDTTGINRFDPATGNVLIGGLSGVPRDTGASSGPGQFLPRIGIAYRFKEKMVIRAGYGQSADPRPFIDFRNAFPVVNLFAMPALKFDLGDGKGPVDNSFIPVTTLRQGLVNPNPPPDLTQGVIKLPSNAGTTTYPDHQMRKYIQSWNLTVERELPLQFTGQIGYVGTRSVGQMGFININAGAPGTGNAGRALARLGLTSDINEILPYQTATYDALQMSFKRRFTSSTFGGAYTFSKAINYTDNDGGPRIQYYPEAQRNRGLASYDRTHNFQLYGFWELPFGRGRQFVNDGILSKLLGGFQVSGVMSAISGSPISIVQNNGFNLNAPGSAQVPDQVNTNVQTFGDNLKGTPPPGADPTRYQYFDRTAFAAVNIPAGQPQRFGSVGRNTLRGPGFFNMDLSLFRTIAFTEGISLQLRAEALNALNHPNFNNPTSDVTTPSTFGYITSTVGQGSRIFRLGARVSF